MRVIETDSNEDLGRFVLFLRERRIPHRVFEERGRQVLEVADPQFAEPVREAFEAWRAGRLRLSADAADTPPQPSVAERLLAWGRRLPVLAALVLASILVFPFVLASTTELHPLTAALLFDSPENLDAAAAPDGSGPAVSAAPAAAFTGQFWRLWTPTLVHFSLLHLLFNLAITVEFGRRVELGRGSATLAGLVLVLGLCANLSQYLWSGSAVFGGLSGVCYGLLGYLLVRARRFPRLPAWQLPPAFAGALLLFLVAFSTGITEAFGLYIANAAHWGGLLAGAVVGALQPPGPLERGAARRP